LSVGVVSALGRASGRAVQTDAKISPNNYGGPLIDIHGRVLGVLTPLPVMGDGELSGAQFYDSGIGFAATLDAWQSRLDSLKAGHDLAPGLMGISLKPGDVYVLPAEVAVCQLHSPAYKAGLRAGDKIVEVDGRRIQRQMQLRHALGPHYAGDTVAVTVEREGKRIETSIELVERLEPFEYPLLGVLPMRERRTDGVVVRHVYAGSGADEAGMKPGDRIVEAGGQTVKDVLGLQQFVASHDPSQALAVKVQRGAETLELSVKLGKLNTELAKDLPAAVAAELAKPAEAIETGLVDARLPEEKQECWLYVPESYHPGVEHGLVIWYAPPGKFEKAEIERQWKKLADEHRLLVLVPRPGEAGQWNPSEVAVVRKFADNVLTKYTVDRSRVVVHGRQAGGVMAWLTALAHRNLVRGVAPLEAPLPARATIENDPVQRLFVYSFSMKDSPASAGIEAGHQRLKAAKVPLTIDTAKADQEPTAAQLEAIVAWLDQLDRI
jgi:serine protease Do